SGTRLEHLLVRTEPRPKPDMFQPNRVVGPTHHVGYGEHHAEMLMLRGSNDVEHLLGAERAQPTPDRGQIGSGIAETAVALLHNKRERRSIASDEAGRKHAYRAVVDHSDPTAL